jgi:ribonucleoside-diphosphate reductase alpha chain
MHPQLSSCYLTSVQDDLDNIFKSVRDNALLSKWSGGLGNDWTNVRALGSHIKGTNGESQGVIPFLKVVNDAAVAVNQGGKRKGAVCTYLEVWHSDIDEFLDLRKNTGDDRRRAHDMNTASWIPDLFMERVEQDGKWTLFSPSDAPDLHDLYGQAFRRRYEQLEQLAASGALPKARTIKAVDLWRKMLGSLFETGHPWITFKDPSNIRSPQDHAGVVHSSNLCTEILLNTSRDEVAVCNLASINLPAHMVDGQIDGERLGATVRTAVRMLDNVIDINYYPIPEAESSNMKHRPVGLGLMGFQDSLWHLGISYASDEALEFADRSMELISWHTIYASSQLAAERGAYPSYKGSKWDRGLLPIDTIDLLAAERGQPIEVDRSVSLDWEPVRESIRQHGMRNSNTMAIAPTATISNIQGVTQSIEPMFTNLFVKSNLSGEFTIVNESLVAELEEAGLWNQDLLDEIKYWDGSIAAIESIPLEIRLRYPTAFEVEPEWLIEAASRRQKWIDQGQSLNLYIGEPSGRKLNDMYMMAWKKGLKTTYYLRSRSATQTEKSTLDVNRFGIQPRWMKSHSASSNVVIDRMPTAPIASAPVSSPQAKAEDVAVPAPNPNPVASIPQPSLTTNFRKTEAPAPAAPRVAPPVIETSQPLIPNVNELRMRTSHDLPVEEEFGCEACQ